MGLAGEVLITLVSEKYARAVRTVIADRPQQRHTGLLGEDGPLTWVT